MSENVIYIGRDLEAMSFAVNYHRWILQEFGTYLGKRLVEVGAGNGSFSELLLERRPESISLVEPSKLMFNILEERLGHLNKSGRIEMYNAVFKSVADRIKLTQQPDSIIYVNVMEHIADDEAELRTVYQTLGGGGRLFIFVPAFRWLFGSFDEQIGHFRRYTKGELEAKCRRAGFKVIESRYFDLVGIAPWWIRYRLLKSSTMKPWIVNCYDKCAVPAIRAIESVIKPPVGKNVILVAEKIASS